MVGAGRQTGSCRASARNLSKQAGAASRTSIGMTGGAQENSPDQRADGDGPSMGSDSGGQAVGRLADFLKGCSAAGLDHAQVRRMSLFRVHLFKPWAGRMVPIHAQASSLIV